MRYSSRISAAGPIFLIILLIGVTPALASPDVWTPKATTSENNTSPTGLPSVTARENTGSENTAVISGAVAIVAQTVEAQENIIVTTRMPAPSAQSKDGVRVDNQDNLAPYGVIAASIPYSGYIEITLTDVGLYRENNGPVPALRGVSGWVIRADNFATADNDQLYIYHPAHNLWYPNTHNPALAEQAAAGFPTTTSADFSPDADSFFENVMFRHQVDFTAAPTYVRLRVDTWVIAVGENALRVDLNNNGTINDTDNLHAVIADNDSNGLMDLVYLSAGPDLVFNNQVGNDNVVTATGDNDENIPLSEITTRSVRIGNRYKFKVTTLHENAPVSGVTTDIAITIDNYYTGTLNVDVNGDCTTDALNFCFVDDNSDGVFENIYISAFDDNFIEGNLMDNSVSSDNDEKLTSTENILIGSYQYLVQGPNPLGDSDDISVSSLSRWFGNIYLDTDGDGNVDNIVYFCISDNDSNGIFNVLQISVNDNVFGQGTLDDNAYLDDDALITAPDNVRIGTSASQSCLYLVEFADNPAGAGYDFRVTFTSWYTGTITLHGGNTFNFVIWDPDSDGIFENLVFDDNRDDNYSGDPQYDSYPASPVHLPRGSQYAYKVVWFDNEAPYATNPTYGTHDLVMQPLDTASPAFSGASPAQGAVTSNTTPTISVALADQSTNGYKFDIEPGTIVMKVRGQTVSHTYSGGVVLYTPATDFSDGVVSVSVSASDYAKNSASTSWSFTIDTTVPTVTLSPSLGATETATGWTLTTTNSSIEISGSVGDATGVTVKINDKVVPVVGGSFSKTVNLMVLGTNTFTIAVTDAAGNTTTRTLSAIRAGVEPPPVTAPAISPELAVFIGVLVVLAIVIMVFVKMALVKKY